MNQGMPSYMSTFHQNDGNRMNNDNFCLNCNKLQMILEKMSEVQNKLVLENHQLYETVNDFQQQNLDMMGKCGKTYRQYETFVQRLNQQLVIRDQIIEKLQQDLQQTQQDYDDLQLESEEKLQICAKKMKIMDEEIKKLQTLCENLQFKQHNNQLKELKEKIRKDEVSQLQAIKKKEDEIKKLNKEKEKLKEQIQSKELLILQKEALIKKFSQNNDELRIQLIDMKAKHQIEEINYYQERRSISNTYEDEQEKEKLLAKNKELTDKLFELEIQKMNAERRLKKYEEDYKNKMYESTKTQPRVVGRLVKQSSFEEKIDDNVLRTATESLIQIYEFCSRNLNREADRVLKNWKRLLVDSPNSFNVIEFKKQILKILEEIIDENQESYSIIQQGLSQRVRPSSLNAINQYNFDS